MPYMSISTRFMSLVPSGRPGDRHGDHVESQVATGPAGAGDFRLRSCGRPPRVIELRPQLVERLARLRRGDVVRGLYQMLQIAAALAEQPAEVRENARDL